MPNLQSVFDKYQNKKNNCIKNLSSYAFEDKKEQGLFAKVKKICHWLIFPNDPNENSLDFNPHTHQAALLLLALEPDHSSNRSDVITYDIKSTALRLLLLAGFLMHFILFSTIGTNSARTLNAEYDIGQFILGLTHVSLFVLWLILPLTGLYWWLFMAGVTLLIGIDAKPILELAATKGFHWTAVLKNIAWLAIYLLIPALLCFSIYLITAGVWVSAFLASHWWINSFVSITSYTLPNFLTNHFGAAAIFMCLSLTLMDIQNDTENTLNPKIDAVTGVISGMQGLVMNMFSQQQPEIKKKLNIGEYAKPIWLLFPFAIPLLAAMSVDPIYITAFVLSIFIFKVFDIGIEHKIFWLTCPILIVLCTSMAYPPISATVIPMINTLLFFINNQTNPRPTDLKMYGIYFINVSVGLALVLLAAFVINPFIITTPIYLVLAVIATSTHATPILLTTKFKFFSQTLAIDLNSQKQEVQEGKGGSSHSGPTTLNQPLTK
ncbi:hypothetical protein N9Y17_02110 [Gammaproteobacteria bacterium]|nr:hypothetical protein [Gammaproteobacteria bacterium]